MRVRVSPFAHHKVKRYLKFCFIWKGASGNRIRKNTELEHSLKVVISIKEFTKKIIEQLTKIQQNAKIDGFRKGKVPIGIVRKKYGQEAKNEVINNLIQASFQKR